MTDAQEIYRRTITTLPIAERLRLASLILQDLIRPGAPDVVAELEVKDLPSPKEPVAEIPALARAQAYVQSLVPEGRDLVDELIAERRQESQRESM